MTRTFSFGNPNICASTLRMLTTPCVESYSVSISSIPHRSGGVQFERIVGFGRRDVSFVQLDGRTRERGFGITTMALQSGTGP